MNTWLRQIRWIVPVLVVVTLLAIPPMVHGGGRWSGMDPEFNMADHKFNVTVEWPSENSCDIVGPVRFKIVAPGGEFVSESEEDFRCGDGSVNTIATKTKFTDRGKGDTVRVSAKLRATEDFPVAVIIEIDNEFAQRCVGASNKTLKCKPLSGF